MRTKVLGAITVIVSLHAGLLVACSDPVSHLPTTPSPPTVGSFEIIGPDSLAPGQSAQFIAAMRLSDGSTKLLDGPVRWTSGNGLIVVNAAGVATAGQAHGDGLLTATGGIGATSRQSSKEVVIVPAGTYRVVGVVSEADFPALGVLGASVAASPGTAFSTTDFAGRYRLYGVPADATITVTKAGYSTFSQAVHLTGHTTQNVRLALPGPRLTITGPYKLTLDGSGSCVSARPLDGELRRRSYDAVVTQTGPDITVTLTEPRFMINSSGSGNRFTGRAGANSAAFFLAGFNQYYYYGSYTYPDIAERLLDGNVFVPSGSVIVSGSAASLSGVLSGSLFVWDARFPALVTGVQSYCYSTAIQFSMTPR